MTQTVLCCIDGTRMLSKDFWNQIRNVSGVRGQLSRVPEFDSRSEEISVIIVTEFWYGQRGFSAVANSCQARNLLQ